MNVNIDIKTVQRSSVGEIDSIEVKTSGKIYYKNDGVYVIYDEIIESGKITNTIKIVDDTLSIKKNGHISSLMTFDKGKATVTKYKTPQGVFFMDIKTNEIDVNIKEDYIEANINYNIDIQGLFSGINEISIKIRKI